MEAFSQSLSKFRLDALLSTGNDSIEHTDPALENTVIGQPSDCMDWIHRLGRDYPTDLNATQEVSPL